MPRVNSIGVGGLYTLNNGLAMPALVTKNAIGRSCGFGFLRFGKSFFGDSKFFQGVYQKRVTGYNNTGRISTLPRRSYYVRMRTYTPTNPRTEIQQNNRNKFKLAVETWQTLTENDKLRYIKIAKKRNRIARNVFISEFMKS